MIFEAVPGFLSLLKFCRKDLVFVGRASFFFWIGLDWGSFLLVRDQSQSHIRCITGSGFVGFGSATLVGPGNPTSLMAVGCITVRYAP